MLQTTIQTTALPHAAREPDPAGDEDDCLVLGFTCNCEDCKAARLETVDVEARVSLFCIGGSFANMYSSCGFPNMYSNCLCLRLFCIGVVFLEWNRCHSLKGLFFEMLDFHDFS